MESSERAYMSLIICIFCLITEAYPKQGVIRNDDIPLLSYVMMALKLIQIVISIISISTITIIIINIIIIYFNYYFVG
jgi:hypothetical protein